MNRIPKPLTDAWLAMWKDPEADMNKLEKRVKKTVKQKIDQVRFEERKAALRTNLDHFCTVVEEFLQAWRDGNCRKMEQNLERIYALYYDLTGSRLAALSEYRNPSAERRLPCDGKFDDVSDDLTLNLET